jgi:hypothetical protein
MARMLREASTQEIGPEVQELLAPVRHYVEGTVNRLARKSFKADPIVEAKYSRVTSIVSWAYKRHGSILERALVAALTAAPHLQVWAEPHFRVSQAAERLADSDQTALGAELPYGAEGSPRALQIDLLVYNRNAKRLGTYESKRGFGYHDSGKKRSMLRDLRCVHMLLRSYGRQQHGLEISESAAHMIFYYGQCSVGPPWALTRDDLDDHFQAPVVEVVEQINNYFRERLDELLAAA